MASKLNRCQREQDRCSNNSHHPHSDADRPRAVGRFYFPSLLNPYFTSSGITIFKGDALDILRQLPDGNVDAVITDPPYGIDFQSNMRSKRLPKIANDQRPFIWFLHDAYRVTKDGGCCICFCRWDTEDVFKMAMEAAGFRIKSQLVWHGTKAKRLPVSLRWPHGNCAAVAVTNHTANTIRGVHVIVNDLKWWFDEVEQFVEAEDIPDGSLPMKLTGGSSELKPGTPTNFNFLNTVTASAADGEGHALQRPESRRLRLRRKGRWQADFRVAWGDAEAQDFRAILIYGKDSMTPEGDIVPMPSN